MSTRGIFWRLCRHRPAEEGLSVEDFFTELWGYVLARHHLLLDAVLGVMDLKAGSAFPLAETRVEYGAAPLPGSRMPCRPDMRVTTEALRLLIEHKVDADQHHELCADPVSGEVRSYSELERYLAVAPEAKLALVTRVPVDVQLAVISHGRYVRPLDRPHFMWRDFFPLVESYAQGEGASDAFVVELARFRGELEMRPPREDVGVIPSANALGMKAERAAMRQHWASAIMLLARNGWRKTYWGLEIEHKRGSAPTPRWLSTCGTGRRPASATDT